jgi:bifunctional ADP-heptose synthase (sugar kinase/adenylyltransferase)
VKNLRTESELLELASRKRVLFIGETIEDVYHYVRPLGRPTKDAIVCVEWMETEIFIGGVVAARKNAEDFCASAYSYSTGPVIRKERFVEQSHVRKLFEIYVSRESREQKPFENIRDFDAIIVADYGHGMMNDELIEQLVEEAAYLAVNVQTNSGNYGFNLATKYPRCDYLCVDEPEARLATQNRDGEIQRSVEKLSRIAPKVVVTLGKLGAIAGYHDEITRCEAFTDKVVDTIGAGDAFFAITALVAEEADMDSLMRIGNAAGALKSQIVGHRDAVRKDALLGLLAKTR